MHFWNSIVKQFFTAMGFPTRLPVNTQWSTPECFRTARKESRLRFLEFRVGCSNQIATLSGQSWTEWVRNTFSRKARQNEAIRPRFLESSKGTALDACHRSDLRLYICPFVVVCQKRGNKCLKKIRRTGSVQSKSRKSASLAGGRFPRSSKRSKKLNSIAGTLPYTGDPIIRAISSRSRKTFLKRLLSLLEQEGPDQCLSQ
jgi:hypothetical protein